jgi:general secretion pathway protein I
MRAERGFTLLEVLVAFAIAALALGVMFRAIGTGLGSAAVAARYQQALSRARSHLAAAGVRLVPGTQSGEDGGGFSWRVRISVTAQGPPLPAGVRAVLYAVRVTESWDADGRTRAVTLETERAATVAAPIPAAAVR